jgi:hypothetical protein
MGPKRTADQATLADHRAPLQAAVQRVACSFSPGITGPGLHLPNVWRVARVIGVRENAAANEDGHMIGDDCVTGIRWRLLSQRVTAGLACLVLLAACAGCTTSATAGRSHRGQPSASWQLVMLPRSIARTWVLASVSCPTVRFCMVVGVGAGVGAAAATLTGSVWHVLRPVEREGSGAHALVNQFTGVSCPSTTDCVAVGLKEPAAGSNGTLTPLAEHWNGTRWSIQATAPLRPLDWAQSFTSVSCPSATTCIAAAKMGSEAAGTGADGAAEIWHPAMRQWRNTGLRGATFLFGVSCVSDVNCVAVSTDAIYTWNHGRWARQRVRGLGTSVDTVSCASLVGCVVIAGNDPSTSLVLRGRTWSVHAMPGLRGNNWTWFGSLSCPAANSCTAVGYVSAHNQNETATLLAEHWNGDVWHVEPIKPVPHGTDTSLSAVSCRTSLDCVIVGGQGLDDTPFVERST